MNETGMMRGVRVFFGIFMVLVYLGMAALLALNFFGWSNTPLWNGVRWTFAAIFALYGIYRCYRQVTGRDYYRLNRNQDQDDEQSTYTTYAEQLKKQQQQWEGGANDEKK